MSCKTQFRGMWRRLASTVAISVPIGRVSGAIYPIPVAWSLQLQLAPVAPRSINHHCTCLSHDTISTTSSSCKPPRCPCAAHAACLGVHACTRRRCIGRRHVMSCHGRRPGRRTGRSVSPCAHTPPTRSATEPAAPPSSRCKIRVASLPRRPTSTSTGTKVMFAHKWQWQRKGNKYQR